MSLIVNNDEKGMRKHFNMANEQYIDTFLFLQCIRVHSGAFGSTCFEKQFEIEKKGVWVSYW